MGAIVRPTLPNAPYELHEYLRRLADATDAHDAGLTTLTRQLASQPKPPTLAEIQQALSSTGSHPLNLTQLIPVPPAPTPPTPTPPTDWNMDPAIGQPAGIPASPNLRWFRGQMCGLRVPGLAAVPGGAVDPSIVLSWFYDRYGGGDRALIRNAMLAHGYTHFQLSWPDSRAFGTTVAQYVAFAQELTAAGFYVGHFMASKDYDPADPAAIMAALAVEGIFPALIAAGVIPWASIGWELNLWLDPTQVQSLIDQMTAILVPAGVHCYVHFSEGVIAWQQDGGVTADFWNAQVGKLTGLLYQKILADANGLFQAHVDDGLSRFAGNFGFVTDSGFGHPFDYVAYELTASFQFNNAITEGAGDYIGLVGIYSPAQTGPAGTVAVMGFGNGATAPI